MAEYVEARSLASLNTLASNPPQYPTKPTEKKQEPLTLYISRVPGTRDIILSTFRPQIKNVTAEDVASSLYYIHLNTPEDDLLVSNTPIDVSSSRQSLDNARGANLISRKPVAAVPNASHLSNISEPSSRVPYAVSDAPSGKENQRYAAQVSHATSQPGVPYRAGQQPPQRGQSIQRKPLGPRAALNVETQDAALTNLPPYSQISLPPRPDEIDNHPAYATHHTGPPAPPAPPQPPRPDSRSPSPSKRKPFAPFSLRLIRRDRSSGQQWNVGQVASFQLEQPEQYLDDKYIPSPSINIHLETPGYSKFRGMPPPGTTFDIKDLRESLDAIRPGSSSAATHSPSRQRIKPELTQTQQSPISSSIFEREVNMIYSPSWTANIRNAFRRRESRDDDLSTSPRPPGYDPQGSVASVGSFGGDFDGGEAPVITVPGPGLKPQGYMFLSPWDGRCEFRTGNGGRSLRCKHILPSLNGQWNPLVDGGGNLDGDGGRSGHHRNRSGSRSPNNSKGNDVSELRFNLPTSELFNNGSTSNSSNKGLYPHEGRERTRDKIFNQLINKTEDDVDDEEYESVGFDLSLGREKAGGGNRGKRAKMGKLIIWDEGLKMLDLVVAANVGVWWGVWERRSE
ncbi:hypothetical protein BJ170DRAFT_134397 [Xylariales sp. AK1849]|nr:hypothetical protein BJ170DRAFT_134397 [Xylariales sp. AK1849]